MMTKWWLPMTKLMITDWLKLEWLTFDDGMNDESEGLIDYR